MREIAHHLYYFLRQYDIDPDKVKLILRADSNEIAHEIMCGVRLELKQHIVHPIEQMNPYQFKLNGISISITSLDSSR